ncbi:MAG: EamA family transporter [Nanoarchaeota archaeon]|nr:EamA family transporter [Nanoarchaeota archaeon]
MKAQPWAILLMVLTTVFTSTAQVLYKFGVKNFEFTFLGLLTNYYLIGGLALYGLGAVLMLIALKGGELTVLYPIIATSYIWVGLLSSHFFGEILNALRWSGILAIVAGVVFVSLGSKEVPHD